MPEEPGLARTCEPHHSALTSGSATEALPNSSPGHLLAHSQSWRLCASSQRQMEDHTFPRSAGWTNRDKFFGKLRQIPRKQAE